MTKLLNVDQALNQLLSSISILPSETINLAQGYNRVLAEDVVAKINLPPFANSSMDGYAVRTADIGTATQQSPVQLNVILDIPAGVAPSKEIEDGQAARIMTGAPIPNGADAVIPVEDTDSDWSKDSSINSQVKIFRSVKSGDYIRPIGENIQQGELVLKAGTVIRPQEIGMLAALGQPTINVYKKPRVAIFSIGDELISVEDQLTPGKIYEINQHTLAALVQESGGVPIIVPTAKDIPEAIQSTVSAILEQKPDMIISSGGVSVGVADFTKDILSELGNIDFWKINLKPGKPFAYGSIHNIPYFGLPGNPVSVMVTFDVFVRPSILKQSGRADNVIMTTAIVGEPIHSDGRRNYVRVKLEHKDNQLIATTTGTQSSGALMSMVLADGLLIVPENTKYVDVGSTLPVRLLRLPNYM